MRTKKTRQMIVAAGVVLALLIAPAAFAVVQDGEEVSQAEQSRLWAPVEWFVQMVKSVVVPGWAASPNGNNGLTEPTEQGEEDGDLGAGLDPNA